LALLKVWELSMVLESEFEMTMELEFPMGWVWGLVMELEKPSVMEWGLVTVRVLVSEFQKE
jgi:hypothetical protein